MSLMKKTELHFFRFPIFGYCLLPPQPTATLSSHGARPLTLTNALVFTWDCPQMAAVNKAQLVTSDWPCLDILMCFSLARAQLGRFTSKWIDWTPKLWGVDSCNAARTANFIWNRRVIDSLSLLFMWPSFCSCTFLCNSFAAWSRRKYCFLVNSLKHHYLMHSLEC